MEICVSHDKDKFANPSHTDTHWYSLSVVIWKDTYTWMITQKRLSLILEKH